MINTIRKVFNILKDMKAMSQDIMELQDEVNSLECDKANDMDLWDLVEECDFLALEERVEKLEYDCKPT
jgi:hypothetical protein